MSLWRRTLTVEMGGDGAEGNMKHVRWEDVRGGDLVFSSRCSGIPSLGTLLLVSLGLFDTSFHGVSFLGVSSISILGLWCLEVLSARFFLVSPSWSSLSYISSSALYYTIEFGLGLLSLPIHIHAILYRHALQSIRSILFTKIESLPKVDLHESLHLSDM
jgi:hypothetical protein